MKKEYGYILLGFLPAVVGYAINLLASLAINIETSSVLWTLSNFSVRLIFSLIMLYGWYKAGKSTFKQNIGISKATILTHIPAALCLFLRLWQELATDRISRGLTGLLPQYMFQPFLAFAARLTGFLSGLLTNRPISLAPAYIVSFILMSGSFWLGQKKSSGY
ncbi:MAG: hypothetical protein VB078_06550 [Clostridiaceae bacterium]|nr:hypothetical protein [Clostridiaceae bacterium]